MNEPQFFNVVLATGPAIIVILIGILVNNVRLGDLKDSLRAEIRVMEERITSTKDVLRAEMQTGRAETQAVRSEIEKNQSEMLHRFGDLDTRLNRMENSLGMNRG